MSKHTSKINLSTQGATVTVGYVMALRLFNMPLPAHSADTILCVNNTEYEICGRFYRINSNGMISAWAHLDEAAIW